MSELLINELRVLRDSCSRIRDAHGLTGTRLDDVILKLEQMVVDHSLKGDMESGRRDRLARLGYDAGGATTVDRMRAVAAGPSAAVLAADLDFWRGYADATGAEAATAPGADRAEVVDRAQCERLAAYLRTEFPAETGLSVVDMSVMTEGYSKKTYLVKLSGAIELPGEIVVRADQAGHYISTTVRDEYDLLCVLEKHGVPVPHPFAIERGGDVIGNAFMVVSKVEGRSVGDPYNAPPANAALTRSTARAMASLHAVPLDQLQAAGLKHDPARPHIDEDFEKYDRMWKDLNVACPTLDVAFQWIKANMPLAHGMTTLVHNDFSYNNMQVDGDHVAAVLDWEFAHIGNPAADLAYHKYVADRMSGFDLFKQCYAEAGRPLPSDAEIDFYYIWGMTRLGVMILQAQDMFDSGRNLDIRFAIAGARYLRHPMQAIGERLGAILQAP